ncbi:MAG: SRPBCC family protein [Gemmatimonadaceae bacterium]
MIRFLLRAVLALVILFCAAYVFGLGMPRDHVVASRINLSASPDSVFSVLRALGDYPAWDKDYSSSVRGKSRSGREVWVQEVTGMTMSVEVRESRAPSRLVTQVVTDEKSQWGGTWTYEVKSTGAGTEVTITEQGWIKFPPLRVLMKMMGSHRTADRVLKNLGARFDELVMPSHVR